MKVRSLIQPITSLRLDGSWTAYDALKFMECLNQKYVTIVDNGEVLGIIAEEDIWFYTDKKALSLQGLRNIPVSKILSGKLIVCDIEDSVESVLMRLQDETVQYVAVKEKDHVVGIVSQRNLQQTAELLGLAPQYLEIAYPEPLHAGIG